MNRVIFLDVDGVLNHLDAFKAQAGRGCHILCDDAVMNLFAVQMQTGARVVLSSTWRKGGNGDNESVRYLRKHGVLDRAHEDWKTVDYVWVVEPEDLPLCRTGAQVDVEGPASRIGHYGCRGDEIAEWLGRHPEVDQYVIVDDDGDMLEEQKPFFVQTDFRAGGLTKEKAAAIVAIFARL